MSDDTRQLCSAVPTETWDQAERGAWSVPPALKPSEWAEKNFRIRRGNLRGPYNGGNAPYAAGIMDIATRPGCVQANIMAPVQSGKSTILRDIQGWKAETDPSPTGLTLPNERKGRQIMKSDVLPLFRHTRCLRSLVGSEARDLQGDTISLMNGFRCDLMWSGSADRKSVV